MLRLVMLVAAAMLAGCASRVCGREFGVGVDGYPRRTANATCRTWVDEGVVEWRDLQADVDRRPWTIRWASTLPPGVRAQVWLRPTSVVIEFRDPAKLSFVDIQQDVEHEVSHVVLDIAGIPTDQHHPAMVRVLKDPAHTR